MCGFVLFICVLGSNFQIVVADQVYCQLKLDSEGYRCFLCMNELKRLLICMLSIFFFLLGTECLVVWDNKLNFHLADIIFTYTAPVVIHDHTASPFCPSRKIALTAINLGKGKFPIETGPPFC